FNLATGTLVTGRGVPGINAYDQALDDGATVVLQLVTPPANKRLAQAWSLVQLCLPAVIRASEVVD
ncbi:hypothetical protein AX14_010844, partial [Amanita brunnescens Koide BX004]